MGLKEVLFLAGAAIPAKELPLELVVKKAVKADHKPNDKPNGTFATLFAELKV